MRQSRKLHRLTAAQVRSLGPGPHHDGGGLYLIKASRESGSWVYRYGSKNMGLGSMAIVTLATAREKARICRELRQEGLDPKHKRDSDLLAAKVAAAKGTTFDQCAAQYIADHRANAHHVQQWEKTLKLYAGPVIGALPVSAVDVALVMKILEPIWPRIPETASRLRGRIELILDWAKVHGYRNGENPARWRGHLDKLLPRRSKLQPIRHHAALNYTELPAFLQELRARPDISARALEFLILTAARSGEVRGATFGEIDFAAKVWTVPKERMKPRREHRVPLSPRALAIVGERAAEARELSAEIGNILIFPGLLPGQPLSDMALLLAVKRLKPDATVHGMRAGFKTWASERANFPREVVEAALAHLNGDKVEAAYQRGDLFEKRRRLMAAWEGYACTPPRAGDVVPLKGRAS